MRGRTCWSGHHVAQGSLALAVVAAMTAGMLLPAVARSGRRAEEDRRPAPVPTNPTSGGAPSIAPPTSAPPAAAKVPVDGDAARRAKADPYERDPAEAAGSLDARCDRCHRFQHGLSHPVGVAPGAMGIDLPLEAGRITCITCHDDRSQRPHGRSGMKPRSDADDIASPAFQRDAMIRTESVEDLCGACHASGPSTAGAGRGSTHAGGSRGALRGNHRDLDSVHAMGLLQAHLTAHPEAFAGSPSRAMRGVLVGRGVTVDLESATCLGCHDGTIAKDVGEHTGGSGRGIRASEMPAESSHPIGVPYRSTLGAHGVELKASASLDPRIRLFNQNLGCGSCHSIYSGQAKYIVFPNERSALCMSCHKL